MIAYHIPSEVIVIGIVVMIEAGPAIDDVD